MWLALRRCYVQGKQASKQTSKQPQQGNHYYINNSFSYMSSTIENKCCPQKICARWGFSSGNSMSTPEHLRELSRQHDVMLPSSFSQNSEYDHMATSRSVMAFTDWMQLTSRSYARLRNINNNNNNNKTTYIALIQSCSKRFTKILKYHMLK